MGLLSLIIWLPLLGSALLALLPASVERYAKPVAVAIAAVTLAVSLSLLGQFQSGTYDFQLKENIAWAPAAGIHYALGLDGISLWLVILTSALSLVAMAASWYVDTRVKAMFSLLLLLEAAMLGAFLSLDLILFFTFFELTLIPMWLMIMGWGNAGRQQAANKFITYTFVGSIFMLVGIVALALRYRAVAGSLSFSIVDIQDTVANGQLWTGAIVAEGAIFWTFALAFLIKSPAFPFHTWMADTYAASPTAGPILSSVMVKMGTYGFLRFALPLFPDAVKSNAPILMTLATIGIVYGAVVAAVQPDMRRLLAFSSLSHMGFVLLGIFSLTDAGLVGGSFQQISHGVTAGGLFLLVGWLIQRRQTGELSEYGGLKLQMPHLATLFFLLLLGSVGLPSTNGFVGEFLSLLGAFQAGYWGMNGLSVGFAVVAGFGVVLAAVYLLILFQKIFYGKVENPENRRLLDLKPWEIAVASVLVVITFGSGLAPGVIIRSMEPSLQGAKLMATNPAGNRPSWKSGSPSVVDKISEPMAALLPVSNPTGGNQ